jgi:membrane protease YdiL (CAAX protease family)
LGLILFSAGLNFPLGWIRTIADAPKNQAFCGLALFFDLFLTTGGLCLILLVLRNQDWPNPFIPLCKFKLDKTITLLLLLSFMPLVLYLFPETFSSDPSDRIHPLVIAFAVSLRNRSYLCILIGFLTIGLFGPIFEEFIFRGLLLEETHDQHREKWVRYALDAFVCLFFAVIHLPTSFFMPLLAAIAFICVRRRSKSLLPSIFMHIIWNTSVLITIVFSGGY